MNSDRDRKHVTPLFFFVRYIETDMISSDGGSLFTFLHRKIYFVCSLVEMQQTTDTALSKNLKRRPPTEQQPP